ncbi:polyketide synthase [Mycobacterium sp. 1164966.3]|uniref:type I polyketide synthase n=1 Tax=Mycobacterium sp. 1164966.3 TaxID=1856861 RepID=UPI0007FD5320|nr:type I polyketide synthase [Mycobacterium sp. 1164966.3]OBA78713.1 polyketide synthase [Mycobacterium sp. 1164966.3]
MSSSDIAIVGIDCRFPKAPDSVALWDLLMSGDEGIAEVPEHRWDAEQFYDKTGKPGAVNHRTGGFISDADAFDHEFFGITPREAQSMDPQQRLLLQAAWRALEDATLDPRSQAGSNTGVFVGVMANEWAHQHMRDFSQITAQAGSGNGYFMTANRLSYQLDLKGPSLAVDTACSSSLVAVHVAAASLRAGECDQALAAGVNIIITPALNVFYTQAGLSAPDGRCKPFSGSADGIGRGEGVAVVVLRRLDDALADGLPVYAVIKGSAVNNDGRSNGITAPNRWAQEKVVETANRAAGVAPEQINFLEAHGTGTLLGDMIEVKALAAAHRRRQAEPCAIGSIKGNLGHTEGAAGVAGLIKAVLSLHHRVVPPSRFADQENPQLRLAASGLRLVTEPMPLPAATAHAGVSSFGIGGTNCHVVLASAPARDDAHVVSGGGVLTLSSNSREGLYLNVSRLADDIACSSAPLAQLCWSSNRIKSSGKARLAISVDDRDDAVKRLRMLAHPAGKLEAVSGTAQSIAAGWLFSGQGTQYPGMSRRLHDSSDAYRSALAAAEAAALPYLGQPIRDVLFGTDDRINRTEFAQPAIFSVQYALARALIELGAEPAWVLGHSIGEFAAAVIAGVLSLDDACRLVVARGRLMQRLPCAGKMLAVRAGVDDVAHLVEANPMLAVAAVNGPSELVLSGAADSIDRAAAILRENGLSVHELTVSHAFHSPLMEPMLEEFRAVANTCAFAPRSIPVFSTLRGRLLGNDEAMDADYWVSHAAETVRFADATSAALQAEPTHLIELGPKRTLLPMLTRSHPAMGLKTLAPLSGPDATGSELTETIAALYRDGLNPKWDKLYPPHAQVPQRLSGYRFTTTNRSWITPVQPVTIDLPLPEIAELPLKEETTMDNVVALFREQAAVLASLAQAGAEVAQRARSSVDDLGSLVRAEVARVSGFPDRSLRATQTIVGDLGFDSIMVADLFSGLARKLPGVGIDPGWFETTTTIGDLIAHVGGAPADEDRVDVPVPAVAPEHRIAQFPEVIAFAERRQLLTELGVENPYFVVNDGVTRDTSIVNGEAVLNFSSYNYLGMSGHPGVATAVLNAVVQQGSSCSASRLLSGEKPVHLELERELADLIGTEDAMVLNSGHATNVTVIGHLLGEGDLVIHDSLAHDSIVQGCKLSGATRRSFPHNNHAALDDILANIRHQYRRVLVVIEGVYSQDGDIPDLPAFIAVKQKHQALLMIDEAHSIGVLGRSGGGIGEHFGVNRQDVELWAGTVSKALAGCGGYVAGTHEVIQYLKYTTPGFIFSVGVPPPVAAASVAAIRLMRSQPEHLRRLRENAELFLNLAREAGIDTGDSAGTPVIPCIVGSSANALRLSDALMRRGINANPILYPAVPEDKARLRFFLTSCHSEEQIRFAVKVVAEELSLLS